MQEAPPSLVIPSPSSSLPSYSCLWEGCHAPLFASEDEVYAHVVAIHAVSGKQICQWSTHPARPPNVNCQTNLRNKGQFVDHISLHFSTALKPFPCQVNTVLWCTALYWRWETLRGIKLPANGPVSRIVCD